MAVFGFAKTVSSDARALASDERGTLAIWTALALFPLSMAVAYSLDLQAATTQRANLKDAADAAALAATLNNAIDDASKRDFAREQFFANFGGDPETITSVTSVVTDDGMRVRASADFPMSLSLSLSPGDRSVSVESEAVTTQQDTICVLALNETAGDAIEFEDDIQFLAPTCSLQSNSNDKEALSSRSSRIPQAMGFCAVGGTKGKFTPAANSECRIVGDPYANVEAPTPGACKLAHNYTNLAEVLSEAVARAGGPIPPDGGEIPTGGDGPITTYDTLPDLPPADLPTDVLGTIKGQTVTPEALLNYLDAGDALNIAFDGATLSPGTYCGGLTIAGEDVYLLPGEYVMLEGPFVVKDDGQADANEALIALHGDASTLQVEDQGRMTITAPKVGVRAGLAVMQDTRGSFVPGAQSRIRDGALSVTGTIYLPEQHLEIRGEDTNVGANAPATSFIVDTIRFRGSGTMQVDVDHVSAGIPAIQPRSDEGARLIR